MTPEEWKGKKFWGNDGDILSEEFQFTGKPTESYEEYVFTLADMSHLEDEYQLAAAVANELMDLYWPVPDTSFLDEEAEGEESRVNL